jgi:hypothetical protein
MWQSGDRMRLIITCANEGIIISLINHSITIENRTIDDPLAIYHYQQLFLLHYKQINFDSFILLIQKNKKCHVFLYSRIHRDAQLVNLVQSLVV